MLDQKKKKSIVSLAGVSELECIVVARVSLSILVCSIIGLFLWSRPRKEYCVRRTYHVFCLVILCILIVWVSVRSACLSARSTMQRLPESGTATTVAEYFH